MLDYVNSITLVDLESLIVREPFSKLFRAQPDIVEDICHDMEESQYDESRPISVWLTPDCEMVVIDGNTRYQAARKAGLEKVPVHCREYADEAEALAYAYRAQACRRSTTDAEIAASIQYMDSYLEAKNGRKPTPKETAGELGLPSDSKVKSVRAISKDHEAMSAVTSGAKSIKAAQKESAAKHGRSRTDKPTPMTPGVINNRECDKVAESSPAASSPRYTREEYWAIAEAALKALWGNCPAEYRDDFSEFVYNTWEALP